MIWVKVSVQVLKDSELSLQTKGLYSVLVALMGRREYCFPSIEYLMQETALSRATVYRMMKSLEDKGYIRRGYDPVQKRYIIRNTAIIEHEQ